MATLSGVFRGKTGAFAAVLIRAYRMDNGEFVGDAVSSASTGAWSITTMDTTPHFVVAHPVTISSVWSSCVLALTMDGINLHDAKGNLVILNGNVKRSSAQSKIGGYSALFDGSGDFLSIPSSTNFDFGTGDFGIQIRLRFNTIKSCGLVSRYVGGTPPTSGFVLRYTGTALRHLAGNDVFQDIAWSPSTGVWYDLTWSRASGVSRLYVGTSQIGSDYSDTRSLTPSAETTLQIGRTHTITDDFDGNIDAVYLFKGDNLGSGTTIPVPSVYYPNPTGGTENALVYMNLIPV